MTKRNLVSKKLFLGTLVLALSSTYALAQNGSAAPGTPGPQKIEQKVRHELVMLPYFSIFDNLAYKVDGNTVTLYGKVTRPTLKDEAGRVVAHVEGVEHVDNQIDVLPLSMFDNQVRRATARAIYGYPMLNRYGMGTQPSIRIIVENGHVTLEGVVNNQTDKNVAGIRANSVPGVFSVTNDLRIGS
jgi:hyperosmotically inducible periplasmic protein